MSMSGQRRAPLFEALKRHLARGCSGFHFPAHVGGRGLPLALTGELARLDLTELPGLDDLHAPTGPIARAQELAAALYGADHTFFLVNGSTAGIQALLLAATGPGQKVLLPRNIHRSVIGGLVLSGAEPVYVSPPFSREFSIPLPPEAVGVRAALAAHPDLAAVLWTHPDYHGLATLDAGVTAAVWGAGLPLLVDEAHGAHLPFHPALPFPALGLRAAAAVQSMHKLGGALTQGSLLHLKGPQVPADRVRRALALIQTASPSYLLMASLDLARRQLAVSGPRRVGRAVELAARLRQGLAVLDGVRVLDAGPGRGDPTKVVVSTGGLGLSGYEAAAVLDRQYGVQVEMAGSAYVLLVVGLGARVQDIVRALRAFRALTRERTRSSCRSDTADFCLPPAAEKVLTPRESWLLPARALPPEQAAGLVAAETISICPPGIPIVFPGEKLTAEVIQYILEIKVRGFAVQATDPELTSIIVH
ncbi:MAG: decarboxylase [Candidatus Desulforudis sp.]|nr:decarboxylase [Desulforudis sp.]